MEKKILLIGPLPPPIGGVSIHIKRLSKLIADDFTIDYVDESSLIKTEYFNLRTYNILQYLKKVRKTDLIYIHSGKRQLAIFHILIGKLFDRKILLTIHAYPNIKKSFMNYVDSFFYSLADKVIVVNTFIPARVGLRPEKCVVRAAFLPPVMEEEPDLPVHLQKWIEARKKGGDMIISANAYQLKIFNDEDLYGLDMCIEAAGLMVKEGWPVSFVYNVSSLEKNRDLFEKYMSQIEKSNFREHFLLLNEELSFVRLITFSDIVLRPTNTDGDALTIREALFLGKPIIASDVIPRPDGTILFKCRDVPDLADKIRKAIKTPAPLQPYDADREYRQYYRSLINSVLAPGYLYPEPSSISFRDKTRLLAEKIPPAAGVMLNYLPFRIRLGKDYKKFYSRADNLIRADRSAKNTFIINNFNNIFSHFRNNSPFYNHYLQHEGCNIDEINSLDDINGVPLITKSSLREMPVESRTIMKYGLRQANTGGTSGSTLSFFLENKFYPREWSHIHYMWKRIGYKPNMTKITIRGKSIPGIYEYRFNQNEFLLNSYYTFSNADYIKLLKVFKRYNTQFIHGYPSAIYYFLKEVALNAPFLMDFLKKNIRGVMFGSEYPSPHFRDYIEKMLTRNTISWYGHTEGVILAGELYEKYEYVPFLSYGYAEAVKRDNQYHLVGTSFDNFAAPFIRYDTEDLVDPRFNDDDILVSFRITEGRLGEFVKDKNNKNISLTALIFGRHHKLFERVNFIQVRQTTPGKILVYYTNTVMIENPSDLFDSTNLNLDVSFEQIREPFKTTFGKIPLLIK